MLGLTGWSIKHTFAVIICLIGSLPLALAQSKATLHTTTEWNLQPSFKYDTLCLLNTLSGDPYYLAYYNESYVRLASQFTPQERIAFRSLQTKIKDQHQGIISAMLALYFSAVSAESLDDMVKVAHDSSELQRNLKATSYYDSEAWKTYEAARPDLEAALIALKRIHFDRYWEVNIRPVVEERREALRAALPRYNIIPAIESRVGRRLQSNKITVYMLYFSEPHGIKIVGTNFITHYAYPFRIVLRNAIHEMMHPPYDAAQPDIKQVIESLRRDPFLMEKVDHHDRSFGYNTLEGLVEEDCVQALEQNIAEQFDTGGDLKGDPHAYWAQQDGGIHVLAVALYTLMQEKSFPGSDETFPSFFAEAVRGSLANGQIQFRNKTFFAPKAPK